MYLRSLSVAIALSAFAASANAETNLCEPRGANGMVAMVLCPPGLDQEAWKNAGIAACETRAPCGAWIWDDASVMPETAPERHDLLTPEQVRGAKAIWINEKSELMVLEKN